MKTKKTAKNPKGSGRKPIEIDLDKVRAYCGFMCTESELADALGISHRILIEKKKHNPLIAEAIAAGYEKAKRSLRGKQFNVAMNGNVTMLIWLGKQYLDQKDKTQLGEDPNARFAPANPENLTAEQLRVKIAEQLARKGFAIHVEQPTAPRIP